ncbi:response regulator [Archangium violaceum]|uniref:hypothetical protein n=1 Tax=Archangium violaceum TaxID=83451 RepID=UPI0036DF3F31
MLKGVKLVAITGDGQDSDRHRAHAAGFGIHLVKPIDPGQLLRILRELSQAPLEAEVRD